MYPFSVFPQHSHAITHATLAHSFVILHPQSHCQGPVHSKTLPYHPPRSRIPSLSITPCSNLIKNTVFPGHISVPLLWALTAAFIPQASHTPSITPATKAAQFSWLISFGTLMYWFTSGSLSLIIYSLLADELCSIASAGRPKRCFQSGPWINCKRGRIRIGRREARGGSRYKRRGRSRKPRG